MELLSDGRNVLLILAGFGLLIFVHELGHYLAARWAGIRCESFAIGMGPPLVAWRRGIGVRAGSTDPSTIARHGKAALEMSDEELARNGIGETEWSLRLFPLGGYVRMLGQDDLDPAKVSSAARSYQRAPVGRRMVVVSAGVLANLALAISLFVVAFMVGVRFEAPVVGAVIPGSPAGEARSDGSGTPGLQPGDVVRAIDGAAVQTFADIQIAGAMARPGQPIAIEVERSRPGQAPERLTFSVVPRRDPASGLQQVGIEPALSGDIGEVRPAERALFEQALARAGLGPEPGPDGPDPLKALVGTSLDAAARDSGGRPLRTQWTTASGRTVERTLQPVPELSVQRTAPHDGLPAEAEPGIAGLVPLLEIPAVPAESPNAARFRAGDVILRVGQVDGPRFEQLRAELARHAGRTVELTVLRDGEPLAVTAEVSGKGLLGVQIGRALALPLTAAPLREVLGPDGTPRATAAAGLDPLPRTRIVSVDGIPVHDWTGLRTALATATAEAAARNEGTSVDVRMEAPTAGREPLEGTLALPADDVRAINSLGWRSPVPGAVFDPLMTTLTAHGNPLTAVSMGFHQTRTLVTMTYLTIDRIVRGSVGVDQLRGPVGIVHLGARVVDRGAMYLVFFLAMISVNLAVLNFLPLPIVDGGLFLYLLWERLTGRPPSLRFQNAATVVGLVFLGALFVFTFYNDVTRIVTGG